MRQAGSFRILAGTDAADFLPRLKSVAGSSIEPNLFNHPAFLSPAIRHLATGNVRLALLQDRETGRLRAMLPFTIERRLTAPGSRAIRAWTTSFGPLGTPFINARDAEACLSDLIAALAASGLPHVLILPEIRADGSFAALLEQYCSRQGVPLHSILQHRRAMLDSHLAGDDYLRRSLSAHHLREYRRQMRRLQELGNFRYEIARTQAEVQPALDRFLELESSGWKGRRNTAMLANARQAEFAREAAARLSQGQACQIHEFHLDGRLIASLIVFLDAGIAYTWKTAFDETLARFSPGNLLMIEVTRQHLADPAIEFTDSCAVEGHPVMDRLWLERRRMASFVLGLTPHAATRARRAAARLVFMHRCRIRARQFRQCFM